MSYQPRPNPSGDTLRSSRDPIRTNFEIIQNRFEDNHNDYSSGDGKHKFMQMPEQTSSPTTAANEGALFTRQDQETSSVEKASLIYREESDGFNALVIPTRGAATFTVGAVGIQTLDYQFNIDPVLGINKTATGEFTVNFENNLPSVHYIVTMGFVMAGNNMRVLRVLTKAVSDFTFETTPPGSTGNTSDPVAVMLMVQGG
jgi:hypothetical protein